MQGKCMPHSTLKNLKPRNSAGENEQDDKKTNRKGKIVTGRQKNLQEGKMSEL